MSELRVDNIVDMGGSGAPQLRKGANVTGISTITQAVVVMQLSMLVVSMLLVL